MKTAVVTFPGSNCDRDMADALEIMTGKSPLRLWHKETSFDDVDLIALPGGFSFGDYLRTGAMSALSPIMGEVIKRADAGVTVIGICNGFQILTEAGLLPGALLRNKNLRFICEDTSIQVAQGQSRFTNALETSQITLPVAHHDGNYFADPDTIKTLEDNNQVLFRYGQDINGSVDRIAGIMNKRGNILGMMPHPERAVDAATGNTDGRAVFQSILNHLIEA